MEQPPPPSGLATQMAAKLAIENRSVSQNWQAANDRIAMSLSSVAALVGKDAVG